MRRDLSKWTEIAILHKRGHNVREIGEQVGMHWTSVSYALSEMRGDGWAAKKRRSTALRYLPKKRAAEESRVDRMMELATRKSRLSL